MQNLYSAVPAPNSQEELALLVGIVSDIKNFAAKSREEQDKLLKSLEAYECLVQVVKLITWRISQEQQDNNKIFYDYLWLLRVYYLGLEDFDNFLETAANCVKHIKITFFLFKQHVADSILGVDNYHDQARLYARVIQCFTDKKEQILLLERLALIYEKKLFLEADVDSAFNRLLQLDPLNLKALRFYKFFYIQTGQWHEVVRHLELIIEASKNHFEKQRAAHELAQIHLYNLNEPQKARTILKEYCSNSSLDIHLTMIESLERLEEYDELIDMLTKIEAAATVKSEKIATRLRMSTVNLKAKKYEAAAQAARMCIELDPKNFLAFETLISSLIEQNKKEELLASLKQMQPLLLLNTSKIEIDKLVERTSKIIEANL